MVFTQVMGNIRWGGVLVAVGLCACLSPVDDEDAGRADAGASVVDAGTLSNDAGAAHEDAGHVVIDAGQLDAGAIDAGDLDGGDVDAGPADAGLLDAGVALDAGAGDAGYADAGASDAGPADAGPVACGRVLGTVQPSDLFSFSSPIYLQGFASTFRHLPRVQVGDTLCDITAFSASTFASVTWLSSGVEFIGAGPQIGPYSPSNAPPLLAQGSRLIDFVTAHDWDGVLLPGPNYLRRGFIARSILDTTTLVAHDEAFAIPPVGGYLQGGGYVDDAGAVQLSGTWFHDDAGSGELVLFSEVPDGSVAYPTGSYAREAIGLLPFDDGHVVFSLDNSAEWFAIYDKKVQARLIQVGLDHQVPDGGNVLLDAGFCVMDPASGPHTANIAAWCNDVERTEVLRFERVFDGAPPTTLLHVDAGVTVVAQVSGHLLVGENLRYDGAGFFVADLGWLDATGFHLIVADQVLPLGFGAWSSTTALLTLARPDASVFELREVPFTCP
jgi:hypothetical protein